MALAGYRDAFFILLLVSLATDLFDGPIARWSGHASALGARLDTIADASTVLAGLLGLYLFEKELFRPELPSLTVFLISYGAAAAACLARFGKLPAYHLYLSKAAAVSSGIFVGWLYLAGYSRGFFLAVLGLGILASCESILATVRLRRFRADIGSVLLLRAREREGDG